MSGALLVKHWTKYGKDRLYVQTTAGEKVGWIDLATRSDDPRPQPLNSPRPGLLGEC